MSGSCIFLGITWCFMKLKHWKSWNSIGACFASWISLKNNYDLSLVLSLPKPGSWTWFFYYLAKMKDFQSIYCALLWEVCCFPVLFLALVWIEPLFGSNFRSKQYLIIVLVVYFTWAINVLCTKSISLPLCRQIAADRALPSENKHTHTKTLTWDKLCQRLPLLQECQHSLT